MKIKVDNKVIGEIDNRVFTKHVKGSVHLMRAFDAWGIDKEAFEKQIRDVTDTIEVVDTQTDESYTVGTELFASKAFERDFGFKPQLFLPRKSWSKRSKHQQEIL